MRPRFESVPRGPVHSHDPMITATLVLFWVVMVVSLVLLISWYLRQRSQKPLDAQDPIELAKIRYAKGEITKEEFTSLKKDLA